MIESWARSPFSPASAPASGGRGAPPAGKTALLALLALLAFPSWSGAQEPPDTLQRPDTLAADTLPPGDSLQVADTVSVANLPRLPQGPPAGWATGVWIWDREGLMGQRDLTLLELLERVPGVLLLRGGDYGAPEAATVFGLAGGRIRVFWDGFELAPLDGGVPDLALVGLAGVDRVTVERGPGELRVHLESLRAREPRPFSLVEAGTGDLQTNFFRGSFLHPRALGGSVGFSLERVDTRGSRGREIGHRTGGWLRYGLQWGDDFGVVAEGRRARRDIDAEAFPVSVERTDWAVRARGRFADDRLTAEVFTGGSSLESGDDEPIVPVERGRPQHGLRVAFEPGPAWLAGTLRLFGGADLPARSWELEGGFELGAWGGGYGRWTTEDWDGTGLSALTLHAWTAPYLGLSAFASWDSGRRGARIFPPFEPLPPEGEGGEGEEEEPEEPSPTHRVTDRTTLRLGASFRWRPLRVQGAWLSVEADSLPPLGIVLDRAGPVTGGGEFAGWEAAARLALPVEGFALTGSYQSWDREARYLPSRMYRGALEFHDVFMETRNLEVWGALGVNGRDPMLVPTFEVEEDVEPELARVPFYQNWYADLQIRVVTVHVFLRWENFTVRQNLQDFPGRLLTATRAVYGVKWVLWN